MEIRELTQAEARQLLPQRPPAAAKWDCGRLLVVGGSGAMPGAVVLCCSAAARSGVGLVRLASVKEICLTVAAHLAECTYLAAPACPAEGIDAAVLPVLLQEAGAMQALVAGPGLGQADGAARLLAGLLAGCTAPMVLDADALNLLARQPALLQEARGPLILTPHVVEFSRLSGLPADTILQNPAAHARAYAATHRLTLVLKGPDTYIAGPSGPVWRHSRHNSGLAKGGSGDVLAGLMGGLLAQLWAAAHDTGGGGVAAARDTAGGKAAEAWGEDAALAAALCAVWLHGQAGWRAREAEGPYAMTPSQVVDALGAAFQDLLG